MFHRLCIHYANAPAGGDQHHQQNADLRQQIIDLRNEVRQDPSNGMTHLKLGHLYAQIWIKSHKADVLPHALGCIERAIGLETGHYVRQIHQLIEGLHRHAESQQDASLLAKLSELNAQLEAKTNPPAPQAAPPPPPEIPKQATPASSPPVAEIPEEQETIVEMETPAISPEEMVSARSSHQESQTPPSEILPQSSHDPFGDYHANAMDGMNNISVETVEETPDPTPSQSSPSTGVFHEDDAAFEDETPTDPKTLNKGIASVQAEQLLQVQKMFRAGKVNELIQLYAATSSNRVKRSIIDGLADRISQWRIEPLLAVGALERDDQVFRHMLHKLLQHDRAVVCQQINIDTYSSDLQRVAATVLSELGIRAALPKLAACLKSNDPIMRIAGLNGISKAGAAAVSLAPALAQMVRLDPSREVRLATAKTLGTINTREAYAVLEDAASKVRLDDTIYPILEKLREKHGEDHAIPGITKAGAPKAKTGGMSEADKEKVKKYVILIIVLIVLVAAGKWYMNKSSQTPEADPADAPLTQNQ